MEIDLSGVKKESGWYAVMTLLALLGLMALGRVFTPEGGRLLTWQEWQVRKLQQAYRAERQQLLEDTNRLAELLAAERPDPARVQVEVGAVRRRLSTQKVESLAAARAQVDAAAQAVLEWASGIGEYNAAVAAVQAALEALDGGG